MDTAQTKIIRLEASLARAGQTVTFERLITDSTTGETLIEKSITVPARARSSSPQDLIDSEARDITIVVSPTLLLEEMFGSPPAAFGIPLRDDRVVIDDGTVANLQNIFPIYWAGALVRINMLARG